MRHTDTAIDHENRVLSVRYQARVVCNIRGQPPNNKLHQFPTGMGEILIFIGYMDIYEQHVLVVFNAHQALVLASPP